MNKPILVTGGAGYIGSHACKALSRAGYLPIAFDDLAYGHRDFVKWGPFEEGDIIDATRPNNVMEQYQPDAVLHFAGFAKQIVTLLQKYMFFQRRNYYAGSKDNYLY